MIIFLFRLYTVYWILVRVLPALECDGQHGEKGNQEESDKENKERYICLLRESF